MLSKILQPWSDGPAGGPLQAGLLPHAFEDQFRSLTQDGPPVTIG